MGLAEEMKHLNMSAALARVGGDEELLKEIAQIFLDENPGALDEIRAAADAGDTKALEKAAHTLKGSVSNFGAQTARDAAYRIEQMGRSGDLNSVSEALANLETAVHTLSSELSRLITG